MFIYTIQFKKHSMYIKRTTKLNNFNFFFFFNALRDCIPAGLYCKLLNPKH